MGVWDGITGQEPAIEYFSRIIQKKQISHAYILEGNPGTPKKKIAVGAAKLLLCEKGNGCGRCHSCRAIESGNHPDLVFIKHEKPDTIHINEIREQLVDDIMIRPYSSSYKIYIVEDAERMNTSAQNALLKTLEEPPYYGIIFLLTTNGESLLPTILSRSIRLKCSQTGNGLEQISEEDRLAVLSVLRETWNADRTAMANAAADWKNREIRMTDIGNLIRIWLRDVLILKTTGDSRFLILSSERNSLRDASERYTYSRIEELLQLLEKTERRVASNVNVELSVELFLAAMKKPKEKPEIADEGWEHIRIPDGEEMEYYNSLQED